MKRRFAGCSGFLLIHFHFGSGWTLSTRYNILPHATTSHQNRHIGALQAKPITDTASSTHSRESSNSSSSLLSTLPSATTAHTATSSSSKLWFPTRIQESVNYVEQVESLYLRHILVETIDMAQLALQHYLTAHAHSTDPFGHVAQLISSCSLTRQEGGRVGWMDLRNQNTFAAATPSSIIPADVIESLIRLSPKPGDVHIVASPATNQVHVILVEEILIRPQFRSKTLPSNHNNNHGDDQPFRVGMHSGQNVLLPRGKLPGLGTFSKVAELFPSRTTSIVDGNSQKKTYMIQTAGCQMNVADSERLAGVLEHELDLTQVASSSSSSSSSSQQQPSPDVVIFNTCTIRDHAEQKVYDALGPYVKQKRQGKPLTLIVTGCVAQQEGEALMRRIPEVDVVMGSQYIPHMARVLEQVEWGHRVVATAPSLLSDYSSSSSSSTTTNASPDTGLSSKPLRGHSVRAWVNVIAGCNEHCTYCVVPAVRGMEQSRSMQDIFQECYDLAQQGYKEVTLLGQNIDAYGRDQVPKRTFAELLHYLNTHLPKGTIERIRYVTSHPRYFSDRVIDAVAHLDKVCECFHMPFQAGDNDVLKNMRRGYTYESYLRIIDRIRSQAPDAAICADVIVGFPGETDAAFERTLDLMKEVKFDNLNSFSYSPRPHTEAALWENQIPEHVKAERLQRVQKLAAEHALERSQRYVGRVEEVLVEDTNPRNPNQVVGRTRQGRQVYFDGIIDELRGQLVNVHISAARTWSLEGELAVNAFKNVT